MSPEGLPAFVDKLKSLSHLGDPDVVRQELDSAMVEDIAEGIVRLTTEESVDLLKLLDDEVAGNVLVELPAETTKQILNRLPDYTVAMYLDVLPMDDALELREDIGDERFEDLLQIIPREDADEIRRLLDYPEDSVGRVMTERFFEVTPETTMSQLLDDIRNASEEKYETVNDVYVVSPDRHLVGLFSLRKALRSSLSTQAGELMRKEVVTCSATDEAEEAARTMSRYGFYALPVLDQRGRMVGIFTGDDAQAILREAETQIVESLGAVSGETDAYLSLSVRRLAMKRFPWLLALFMAETLTGSVMRWYGGKGEINPTLFFVPLLIGAGGNSGSQTTTMVTRSLAVGEIHTRDWFIILGKEFRTSLLVGLALGITGYLRALAWGTSPKLCIAIALSLPLIVLWSTSVGAILPLAAKRLGFDPAVMSAPFISTLVDATGLIIYFEIVKGFFGGTLGPVGI